MVALERAEDRFTSYLLPPRTSLVIFHDEILVVDAGEMKMQHASVNCCFPHQTGVTERSIGCTKWGAADRVLHEMVISHQSYRISNGLVVDLDREHHV